MNCIYKPYESGFILLIAVITLVHFKTQNYHKRKITTADNRPNHPIIRPEHLGKPLIEHIECLQRGHQRKISRKIFMVF